MKCQYEVIHDLSDGDLQISSQIINTYVSEIVQVNRVTMEVYGLWSINSIISNDLD